jgi:KDO2-lipid IV(A) lauroyltransferase
MKALKAGDSVALLPDQVPPEGQGVWASFFGRDAYTMTLSVRLAQQSDAVVLLVWARRLSWGRGYRVQVEPLDEKIAVDLNAAAIQVNRAMESLVLQAPGQYLWGYARYKQPKA